MTWTARNGRSSKSDAQSATTLGTARGQYTTAAHCLHAGAESVGALALDHAGLVCAFHRLVLLLVAAATVLLQKGGKLTASYRGLSIHNCPNLL